MTLPARGGLPGAGRPRAYAAAKLTKFLNHIRQGNSLRMAAHACGIQHTTIVEMLRRGKAHRAEWGNILPDKDEKSLDHKFLERYEQAVGGGEVDLVKVITTSASDGNTADAKWLLSRRNPKQWGERNSLHITGEKPIDRAELVRDIGQLATVVRDEILAMTATEPERFGAITRISERWRDIIAGWSQNGTKPSTQTIALIASTEPHDTDVPANPS